MKKLSVVLPVYNGASYLRESINSVLEQSFKDFELIIVDDCSSDGSPEIARSYAMENDNVIYVRNKKNLKLPTALNRGFDRAEGEYWTWTSCDNLYFSNAFAEMVSVLDKNPDVGLTYSGMELIDEAGSKTGVLEAGSADELIVRNVVGACFLYRASIAKKVGKYSAEAFLCEDYEYWLRFAREEKIQPIEKKLYRCRIHSDSLSTKHEKEIIEKGNKIQKKYLPYFAKTPEIYAKYYSYLRSRDIYNSFRHFYIIYVFFYSPIFCLKEIYRLILARIKAS